MLKNVNDEIIIIIVVTKEFSYASKIEYIY